MRYLLMLLVIAIALFAGYAVGKFFNAPAKEVNLTENYSFVKEIAELASLEVTGTTTLNSSNIVNDGSFTDELKRLFLEKTVRLSAPYSAKYGVDLKDSSLRILRTDSTLKVYLPLPKLLSYEMHLNRLEASNRKGWFQFENEQVYLNLEKKMYTESRAQLEKNQAYLSSSRDRICSIIQRYFAPLHVKTICIYEESPGIPGRNALGEKAP